MTDDVYLGKVFAIGDLSVRTGVKIETIRYYEREGLLATPLRSPGGRRVYTASDTHRLRFLKRCRELGFTLRDARKLVELSATDATTCADVRPVVSGHLANVRGKLKDLRKLEKALMAVEQSCPGSASTDCPILAALSAD